MMRLQPQYNSTSALTTHQLQVERREIEPIQGMGMIDKGQWREFGQDTSTLYEKCHWIFNDHRESGPQFKDG